MPSLETTPWAPLALLASAWVGYFALHSWLASLSVKATVARRWPQLYRRYRLLYNLLATALLVPLLLWQISLETPELWRWSGPWRYLMDGVAVTALLALLVSSRYYDGRAFLGLTLEAQRGVASSGSAPRLTLSPFHRYVRHPWYCLGLIVLWSRSIDLAALVGYGLISGYLYVGARLEEAKLVHQFGDAYRQYQRRVAMLLPLPGWRLTAAEAQRLERLANAAPADAL